jgi:hypothetical protein
MSPSKDMADVDKRISSTHPTRNGHCQPLQHQPTAIQQWLEGNPHDEPWSTSSRRIQNCSFTEAQRLLDELEQEMARDMGR